jgi:3'-phosphoadenosine 5'-phosphosulfate sulfotransferase (PAPS reductase)/FAD synthetase
MSLEDKITYSLVMIREWYEHWDGLVFVAFSGGKDSTVLLDLVRSQHPDVPAVFNNTGLEFPEILSFVRTVSDVTWLRPKMSFEEAVKRHGWPIISKRISQYISEANNSKTMTPTFILRMMGVKSNGEYSPMGKISNKWQFLVNSPYSISDKCCDILKKNPGKAYSKETGRKLITGEMATEGKNREKTYLINGCNAFHFKEPKSTPLAFWNGKDVWEYIKTRNLPYSKIYDMGYKRTGCYACGFGAQFKNDNRYINLQKTHPKQYKYVMDTIGMRDILEFCKIPIEETQLELPQNMRAHVK